MSLEIYPVDFSTRYQLTHAISVQMERHYNDIGKIQIVAPVSDYNITALGVGNIIYDTAHGDTYIVVNTKCDTTANRITVNGYTANWILNKRVILSSYTVGTIETDVYQIVSDNLRSLPRIKLAEAEGLTETFSGDALYGGQLLDGILPVLEYKELGHKMIWDPSDNSWIFKIFKGVDRTTGIHAVAFAEEQGTCSDLVINTDTSTLKNVGYVTYRLSDDTEPVAEVGTATGENRYEKWFKTSVSQEQDETAEEARKRAVAYATMELGKYIRRQSFSVTIDATELGTLYDIGDLVLCASVRFGVSFKARITGVKYTLDITGEKTEIVLGDPVLTALGEMRLNNG